MLNQIHIRDLATIEDQHLHLSNGSTMLTGETGAGKSIFIEAIELALGARGSANIIRPGKERADISLCFDIGNLPKVIEWLQQNDLYQDTNECILRRVLTTDGRSRSYINGLPATLQLVRELAELLFHLHGQYEQQVLLKTENQRDILDRFAEHTPLAATVRQLANAWKTIAHDIKVIREKAQERSEHRDYLQFQLDELSTLQLHAGEWEALELEHHKLTHSEELLRHLQQALQCLSNDDNRNNTLSLLNEARKSLESIQNIEPKADEWLNTLSSALIPLTDLESELCNHLEKTELDPERLQFVETRISQLFTCARKHKITPSELPHYENQLQTELSALDSSDSTLAALEAQQKSIAADYHAAAQKLSKSRTAASTKLAKEITQTIRSLSLPHGDFSIVFEKNAADFSAHGLETITFLIKTNPDQTPQPLAKVISGGELSRLSLAVHLALAHATTTPTLIFDEVDTGVGGATAEKIGKLLRTLGDNYQVFCVTHQAQVACAGHQHLLVEKHFNAQSTHTCLRFLTPDERTQEIARMLGGATITSTTIKHAEEILALA